MNTYSITLPWPPSNNRYYRHNRGRTHVSAEGQAYRDNVARIAKNAMLDIGLAMPVKIRIGAHMPDRRRRDLDNLQKAAFDALTKAGSGWMMLRSLICSPRCEDACYQRWESWN